MESKTATRILTQNNKQTKKLLQCLHPLERHIISQQVGSTRWHENAERTDSTLVSTFATSISVCEGRMYMQFSSDSFAGGRKECRKKK